MKLALKTLTQSTDTTSFWSVPSELCNTCAMLARRRPFNWSSIALIRCCRPRCLSRPANPKRDDHSLPQSHGPTSSSNSTIFMPTSTSIKLE